jgi:hypothetical protein
VAAVTEPDVIDAQLAELASRRSRCVDLLARCMSEIATIDLRTDVLLDRRNLDEPDRMT